jgi:hypothetical protein
MNLVFGFGNCATALACRSNLMVSDWRARPGAGGDRHDDGASTADVVAAHTLPKAIDQLLAAGQLAVEGAE